MNSPTSLAAVALALAVVSACSTRTEDFCESSADCTDPAKPLCDVAGTIGGVGNTCVSPAVDGGLPDAGNDTPDAAEADPAKLSIDRTEVDFGPVVEGNSSAAIALRVENTGEEASGALGVQLAGADAAAFVTGGDCDGAVLEPGASCTVEVTFAPEAAGNRAADLQVAAEPGGTVSAALSGEALAVGDLTLEPTTIAFGAVSLGDSSAAQVFTVRNTGGSATGTLAVAVADGFALSADGCTGATLDAGAECAVSVAFAPAAVGSRVGSLSVMASPGGAAAASLSGTGLARLTIDKTGSGAGTVVSTPTGIACGLTCAADFSAAMVTLSATADGSSVFLGWSGAGCSGTTDCVVAMSGHRQVQASFAARYQLTVNKTGAGTVTSQPAGIDCGSDCSGTYVDGTQVTLTAQSTASSQFVGWSGSGCSGTGPCAVTMTGDRTVNAQFVALHTLSVATVGNGKVTSQPAGIDCGSDCSQQYPQGTQVTLTPAAGVDASFLEWGGACSGAGSCQVSMTQMRSVTAAFIDHECTPSTSVCTGGVTTVCDGKGQIDSTESCALGCNASGQRCNDIDPSNGLQSYYDQQTSVPDLDLGGGGTINTSSQTVSGSGGDISVPTFVHDQASGPDILVIRAGNVTLGDVTVTGTRALAILADGEIAVTGILSASARPALINGSVDGPGALTDGACQGKAGTKIQSGSICRYSGAGGGGFALDGGRGGFVPSIEILDPPVPGGAGGADGGSLTMQPLRGGCRGGGAGGGGGGAVQLVSRVGIEISAGAFVAANAMGGSGAMVQCAIDAPISYAAGGGGAGGGILLEAPTVTVIGNGGIVANGGGGACRTFKGEDGKLGTSQANGASCSQYSEYFDGGRGGYGSGSSRAGGSGTNATGNGDRKFGGGAGGAAGRIRVNTASGGLTSTGSAQLSPQPTLGTVGTR